MLFPNPVTEGKAILRLFSDKTQQIRIDMYTADGRQVQTVANRKFMSGTHYVAIGNRNLKAGTYFITISNEDGKKTTVSMIVQ
jgi:hypothetical protein